MCIGTRGGPVDHACAKKTQQVTFLRHFFVSFLCGQRASLLSFSFDINVEFELGIRYGQLGEHSLHVHDTSCCNQKMQKRKNECREAKRNWFWNKTPGGRVA